MGKFIPESTQLLVLNEITKADEEVACTTQPTTYFNAIHPDMWVAVTAYEVGDCIRPPTDNDFIYECTVAGDSGGVEPGWSTTQDGTFVDGTVTWKAHENYSLANQALVGGDKSVEAGDPTGYVFTVAQKMGVLTHRAGTLAHMCLIEHATKKLHHVTTANTTVVENNLVEAGRTTLFYELVVNIGIE